MKKAKLTPELESDLKALKNRNLIFKKKFYKANDNNKFPEFFHVGTVVDPSTGVQANQGKVKGGTLAEQFLMDDESQGKTLKGFNTIAEKRRRIGEKKKKLKTSIKNARRSRK